MRTARWTAVLGAALLGACGGIIDDPAPEDVEVIFRMTAGTEEEHRVTLDEGCVWCDPCDCTDYWKWDDHIRDLPDGFFYRTLAVSDWNGGVRVRYEIWIEPWVDPGPYDFLVIYELWPDDDVFRDQYDVDFHVYVDPPGYVPHHIVAEQELRPKASAPDGAPE
jgi:hypothetical protein